jgi:outer membrane protein assembly factor BamB
MKMVKKVVFLMAVLFLTSNMNSKAAFGPEEWTQYRMNPENNPVYKGKNTKTYNKKLKTDDEIRSTPVIVGDNVYVGNHNSGDIYSFNLLTGELNWKSQAPNWIHSEVIYANNQLFVGYGDRFFQKEGVRGTGESGMLSLNPETGKILWDFKTDGEVMPTPAYYNGTVYITTGDRHLYGVDPESGEEHWKMELGNVVSMSSPNIKDGVLYVGGGQPSPYRFFAVDLDNRKILWKTELEKVTSGLDDVPPVVYENLVITTGVEETDKKASLKEVYDKKGLLAAYKEQFNRMTGRSDNQELYDHKMYAFDKESGQIKWEKSLGIGKMVPNNKSGAPIVYKDTLFVGSPIAKKFLAFKAGTGEKKWSYHSNVTKAPPVADQNQVFFTDTKGLVFAFDTSSGELLGKKMLSGKLAPSGPVLMNDHLIVGSQDGQVYIQPKESIINEFDQVNQDVSRAEMTDLEFYGVVWGVPVLVLILIIVGTFIGIRLRKGD